MLTLEEVRKLARLARIHISEEELPKYQDWLSRIFAYVEELMSVDIANVEEVSQVTGLVGVQRPDTPVLSPSRDAILAQAPEVKNDLVKVKAIL